MRDEAGLNLRPNDVPFAVVADFLEAFDRGFLGAGLSPWASSFASSASPFC